MHCYFPGSMIKNELPNLRIKEGAENAICQIIQKKQNV